VSQLQQKISLYGLTMIAVGSCIGSGIFVAPGQIAAELPNATLILLVWTLGGLMSLLGALTFAELGGMFTKSGGVYTYLKESYGPLAGFLYGWVVLLVINTGSLAGLCVAFAEYLKIFFPNMGENAKTGVAAVTMLALTAFNMLGVHISQGLSNFFTGLKLASIAAIVLAGVFFAGNAAVPIDFSLQHGVPENLFPALFTGMIGVFFSVGGWHHATYVAGEAVNPGRTVPRAMLLGVLIVTIAYLTINFVYLRLLPIPAIAATKTVAGDAVSVLWSWGGKAVAIAIALSIFGTISIYTMSAPRIYYAMAQDGIFFKQLATVHPRWRTPVFAMLTQVVWALAVLLFFRGFFDRIITFVTFMDALFFALAGASIFIFRKTQPDVARPYRAWGYPVVPFLFVALQSTFAFNILLQRPEQALPGLALMGLGVGVYWRFRK
jgi:basic amino acid/polyamine antiporter, APA family